VILGASVRWRLVAWVTGVVLAVSAVTFVVVYDKTGSQLQAQIDHDVAGDVSELRQAIRALHSDSPARLLTDVRSYIGAQPFGATSTLLFASIPGHGTASNHPELLGDAGADDGETVTQQVAENALGARLLDAPIGLSSRDAVDVGQIRLDSQIVDVGRLRIRVGAGEPTAIIGRAERSLAASFGIAGALALVLALIASYLAGAAVSRPLRRLARVAARVDDGDLDPRMEISATASSEIRVLASHELRTPLTVISGQLEVLAALDHPEPEEVRRVQRLVAAEIARTSRLVDDMLLLARAERSDFLRLQDVDLAPFITELWWSTSVNHERRFELGAVPAAGLTADPDRLAQALRNLLRNAVEHTSDPDGLVRLEVDARPGARVRFAVIDDGPGIPADQRERIFERFHRTDASRTRAVGGAGLGLAIVLAIAEAHGGSARALPAPGGGARSEIELPGLHAAPAAAEPGRTPSAAAQT
jgi:signal transduction histidine kinase